MFDLIKKTKEVLGTSLVVIIAAKLVFACTIIEGSTIIEDNEFLTRIFLGLSFATFFGILCLYLLRKRQGLILAFLSFFILIFHPALRFGGGGGDCGMTYVEFSKWLFGASVLCFLFQLALYAKGKKRF